MYDWESFAANDAAKNALRASDGSLGERSSTSPGMAKTTRESKAEALRAHFLGWQCRVRLFAVRRAGGRPSAGMRAAVKRAGGGEIAPAVTVLIVRREPAEATALFRHQVRRTNDPRLRYERGLEILRAAYFTRPETFSDAMTALFPADSPIAAELLAAGECVLAFAQSGQSYRIPCRVGALDPGDPAFAATYWHNSLFNPSIPEGITILSFHPDWMRARASPPV